MSIWNGTGQGAGKSTRWRKNGRMASAALKHSAETSVPPLPVRTGRTHRRKMRWGWHAWKSCGKALHFCLNRTRICCTCFLLRKWQSQTPRCYAGAAGKAYGTAGTGFLGSSVWKWKAGGLSADAFSLCISRMIQGACCGKNGGTDNRLWKM